MSNFFYIYTLSDATGDLANNLAFSASRQFANIPVKIVRRGRVNTEKKIQDVVEEAKQKHAVILFTMVSQEARRWVLTHAQKEGVIAMDIMGPVLDMLSHYFHQLPSPEPGLQYKVTRDYYKRTEAIEFAVQHDDGLSIETIDQADVVLLGISRTSKTPLSIYLACHGHRAANIPIGVGLELPGAILKMDPKKIVGLVISPDKLATYRSTRLANLGRPDSEEYAQPGHIEQELSYARDLFKKIQGILVVDVTGKAIEEVATQIIQELGL